MGDMSDLPNFKHGWFWHLGRMRIVVVAVAVLMAAIAIGFSNLTVGENLFLKFSANGGPAMIGAPYTVEVAVKNSGPQTAKMELQGVLYALSDKACVEKGKHLTMSNPVTINVGPDATANVTLPFVVQSPCEMPKAGIKAFINGEVDSKRFSATQDAGLSIEIL